MQRTVLLLGLLVAGLIGPVQAVQQISIAGDKAFDVSIIDADRMAALSALFTASRGVYTMELRDAVTGRIDKLQLAESPFETALTAILGPDYHAEKQRNSAGFVYRIINPALQAKPVAPPISSLLVLPARPVAGPTVADLLDDSPVLRYQALGTGGLTNYGSNFNFGSSLSNRSLRPSHPHGIHFSTSTPFIIMNQYEDPFGTIHTSPQIYWQTFNSGFDVNGFYPNGTPSITGQFQSPSSSRTIPGGAGTVNGINNFYFSN